MLTQITSTEIELTNQKANLYRTKFLIAHNALHAIIHKENQVVQNIDEHDAEKHFQAYLLELERAPEIASQPA
jgi:Zn-dependent peptidase ImmA (M78 family)